MNNAYRNIMESDYARRLLAAGALSLCVAAALPTHAQQPHIAARASIPHVVSGGVGLESRSLLARQEKEANLKLVFSDAAGSYLADVPVTIVDANGRVVVQTAATGPWLLVRLLPGTYKVTAGSENGRTVNVGSSLLTVHVRMASAAGSLPEPRS